MIYEPGDKYDAVDMEYLKSMRICDEIKTMPGMHAQFQYGFDASTKYQRIFDDCVLNWMQQHGLIEHVLGHDTTPPAFLCSPRKFTNVQVTELCMQVIQALQSKA